MKAKYIMMAALATIVLTQTSCEKVSPAGVLMAGTAVEDRVEMSYKFFVQNNLEQKLDYDLMYTEDGYSFLVGSDSHITTDPGRILEMFKIGMENDDMLFCHLGDIADTKAEYYITLDNALRSAHYDYVNKYYEYDEDENLYYRKGQEHIFGKHYDDILLPFFPVVGNHDLTHNGWALWSNLFGSSFYEFDIAVGFDSDGEVIYDHFIFLDTASGTLGKLQTELIEQGILDGEHSYRHTFIFGHTNIFRPQFMEFASTFPREETYYLLKQFDEWNASIVFCGHVHKWDERFYNGVYFLTLDSMSERNSPEPGDYLVRVIVGPDGAIELEKVRMNYVATKK